VKEKSLIIKQKIGKNRKLKIFQNKPNMFHKKECFLQKLMDFSQKNKKKNLIPKFMAKVIKFPTKKSR
jgi:hypothetical protein